jgi:hypothetical protein
MKRLRQFFESIAFAGMKPSGPKTEANRLRWLGPLSGPVDRLISGSAPADPLYLTNRTLGQKIKSWTLIAIPCLLLALGVGVTLSRILDPPQAEPAKELTPQEIAAKTLPDIGKNLAIETNREIEVVEIKIEHTGGSRLMGAVRNTTDHEIASVTLVVDMTDVNGSQVGGIRAQIDHIPARKVKPFAVPIAQHDATYVLVREVNTAR